jgi:histidine triad (HIT) family protein
MPSLFSRIIVGELPAQLVFKDPLWVAFLDIKPTSPGHVLLVPTAETQFVADLPAEHLAALGGYLGRTVAAVKRAVGCEAANVVLNDGPAAGQIIPHAHFHVIPRTAGDRRAPFQVHYEYAEGELAAWGAKLRAAWGPIQ